MLISAFTSFAENARDEGGYGKFVLLDAPRGKGAGRGVEVADAAHFAAAAGDVRRREEALATRGRATRPVQWSAWPDPSQEQGKCDHAQLLPEFDAVCAWTSSDRVIIRRMIANLARERENVFVEMEELEKFI